MKKQKKRPAPARKDIEDLEPQRIEADAIKGGQVPSNIMKTKHDTAKNSISNVR